MTDMEKHLAGQLFPAGFAPMAEEAVRLLVEGGTGVAHDMVSLPPGLPRIESGLMFDDGSQTIELIDLARALNLGPFAPKLSWVEGYK